jgi:hypothetical protein
VASGDAALASSLWIQLNAGFRFPFFDRHHLNRIPRTAFEESPIRPFAGAELAANTEVRVNFYAASRRVIWVWHPEHTGFDWAVLNADRGTRAASAVIQYHSYYLRLLLSQICATVRHGFHLHKHFSGLYGFAHQVSHRNFNFAVALCLRDKNLSHQLLASQHEALA